jgi:hypothetical protein
MVGGESMSTLKVNRIEPRTGDTVEIVGFSSDSNQPSFYAEKSGGNQQVSNRVDTKVTLTSTAKRVDPYNLLDANGKFTATSDTAGIWRFTGQVSGFCVGAMEIDLVGAYLFKNGSAISEGSDSIRDDGQSFGGKSTTQTVSIIAEVASGDTIELYGNIGHGGNVRTLEILQRATNFTGNRISL